VPGGLDRLGRREIGLAGAEVDDLDARAAEPIDRRRDGHRRRALDVSRAIGKPAH